MGVRGENNEGIKNPFLIFLLTQPSAKLSCSTFVDIKVQYQSRHEELNPIITLNFV